MRGVLIERRNQVEQGKHPSLAQRVQNLVHARDGQLPEADDLVEFLGVNRDPNASRLVRDDHQRARVRRGRVLDQSFSQVLVQGVVDFLGQIGLILWGREVTGVLPSGSEISKGTWEQEPKSVLDLEKTSAKSRRTSPSC